MRFFELFGYLVEAEDVVTSLIHMERQVFRNARDALKTDYGNYQ